MTPEEKKKYMKKYYEENKDKIKEYQQKYKEQQRKKEMIKEYESKRSIKLIPKSKLKCDGDCFNCIYSDCILPGI